MLCPHCVAAGKSGWEAEVSQTNNDRAWDLYNALDPNDPGNTHLDGDQLAATAGFHRDQLEAVKRHYRDHILPQTGLALAYSHSWNAYWLTPSWADMAHPDIRTWGGGMLNRLYHEARHLRDALQIAYKNIPTTKRKQRLLVRTIYSTVAHVVDQVDIALENYNLSQSQP
jgi:hypothetical protein